MRNLLLLFLLLLLPLPAAAHEFMLDGLEIIHPSLPATPVGSTTGHIYMAIANEGSEPERLLAIETPFGPAVLERYVKGADGLSRPEPVAWIDLPVGETVLLTAGELRGRIEGVTTPLLDGGQLDGALVFEKRGRFKMFYMIDPVEPAEDPVPPQAAAEAVINDTASDTIAIAEAMRAVVGDAAMVAPIAVSGDFALAGWTSGSEGARTILKRVAGKWTVLTWSGPSLLLPATMNSIGIGQATAEVLRSAFAASETALGPAFATRFDTYPGTVTLK